MIEPWASREAILQDIAYYRELDELIERRLRADPHETADIDRQLKKLWGDDLSSLSRHHPREMIDYLQQMLVGAS